MALPVQTFSMGIVQRSSGPRGRSGVPIRAASAHHGSRVRAPCYPPPVPSRPRPPAPFGKKRMGGPPALMLRHAARHAIASAAAESHVASRPARPAARPSATHRGVPYAAAGAHTQLPHQGSRRSVGTPPRSCGRKSELQPARRPCLRSTARGATQPEAHCHRPRITGPATAQIENPSRRPRLISRALRHGAATHRHKYLASTGGAWRCPRR